MEKKDALSILGSRSPITAPGKYTVKVTNCGDFVKPLAKGGSVVAIANFNAMTPYQIAKAKAEIAEGKFDEALNNNLSLSIRDNDYRPAKGERVHIDVDYVETKSGEQALLVVGLTPIQASSISAKCDFSEFLDDAEVTATAEADAENLD